MRFLITSSATYLSVCCLNYCTFGQLSLCGVPSINECCYQISGTTPEAKSIHWVCDQSRDTKSAGKVKEEPYVPTILGNVV